MAAGDVLVGRRIATVDGEIPKAWWDDIRPGDYCGPIIGYTGELAAVFFMKPNARNPDTPPHGRGVQHVTSPPHVFRECADGSLEIRESISDRRSHPDDPSKGASDGWHGYLDEGHRWRQV
jgi:hypothetical protein